MNIYLDLIEAKAWKNELKNLSKMNDIYSENVISTATKLAIKYLKLDEMHKNELKNGLGYISFSNLPVDDDLSDPPKNAARPYSKSYISELVLLGITHACGLNPFSYKEEKKGAFVHEIIPIDSINNNSVSSEGVIEFDFHTDGAYLPRSLRPHTLSLICLDDQEHTPTNLVNIKNVISNLSEKIITKLLSPNFIHTAPETFNVQNKKIKSSIFDLIDGEYEIKVALHNIEALDEEAQIALQKLKNAISNNIIQKKWSRGDLIIFNNLKCLHGRGAIKGKRWLQRCYGTYTFPLTTVLELNKLY